MPVLDCTYTPAPLPLTELPINVELEIPTDRDPVVDENGTIRSPPPFTCVTTPVAEVAVARFLENVQLRIVAVESPTK